MSCEQCFELYVTKAGRKTPCETCPKPLLEPRNEWIWSIFMKMASQSRGGGLGGFTGFDYGAIDFVLKVEEVPETLWPYVAEKLELLGEIAKKYWNKKEEE